MSDDGESGDPRLSRRHFLTLLLAAGAGKALGLAPLPGSADSLHSRPVPSSGAKIPVIGMGSYITFNVGQDPALLADRVKVLRAFFAAGGGMIDSSPMYGSSEAAIGHCLQQLAYPATLFSATKVWTWFSAEGNQQMQASRQQWGLQRFDLMQVHNLVSWEDHLQTLRDARDAGLVRYIGVTTSHGRRHDELATVMTRQPLDFVQFTYNISDREAEQRLLPLASDRGIAVIVNRPFRRGDLIDRLARHPLPAWAPEIGCDTWAQFLLKFIVSHPAVTCAIPATSRLDHMQENMAVLRGTLPDAATRQRMINYVDAL